jgi:hypothetical protein
MRPPPWRDVAGRPAGAADWPLHVKPVPPINLRALANTPVVDEQVKASFIHSLGWIADPARYGKLKMSKVVPAARISVEDVELMGKAGQVIPVERGDVLGGVRIFAVDEPAKTRRRCIKHTLEINEMFGKETLRKVTLPSRLQQSEQSGSGKFAITLDFAAYFDQFELHPDIGRRMCFTAGGRTFRLCRMPMGQRQAVEVAQGATDVLLSFELPQDVVVQSCIDNVRFVGSKDGVARAAIAFVARCRLAGCTINEIPSSNSPGEDEAAIRGLIHQQGDWLGAEYDYASARQRVAAKSIKKLTASWAAKSTWSARNYAAHMGLLFFASSVLRSNVGKYFQAMNMYRQRSSDLAEGAAGWSDDVRVQGTELADLAKWTAEVLKNDWVPCHDSRPASRFIATDASEWGWGAIFLDMQLGTVAQCSVPWSPADRARIDVRHSAHAEPEAVFRALCRFISPADHRPVAILTDSTTAKYSLPKAYSASFTVNAIAARCKEKFPMIRLETYHVPGEQNEVDPLSRGGRLEIAPEAAMRRMMGAIASNGA